MTAALKTATMQLDMMQSQQILRRRFQQPKAPCPTDERSLQQ